MAHLNRITTGINFLIERIAMKNILVPVSPKKSAANTLQYAIDMVEGTDATIYIIKVYGVTKVAGSIKKMNLVLEEDSNKELDDILKRVNTKGVQVIAKSIEGGNVMDTIKRIAQQLEVDLIISSAKSISRDDKVFLGKIAGSLIKFTSIPVLIVPKNYKFKKISNVLMAIKSGFVSSADVLTPIKEIIDTFDARLNLIKVITPSSGNEKSELSVEIENLASVYKTTENATIFQGVLEHLHEFDPDMLCVIRRKKGFFVKLWEKDRVYKKDFESRIPLLVLKGAC